MEKKFTLSCESTVDMPYIYLKERSIPVIFYHYIINGHAYEDNMERNPKLLPKFYRMLDKGIIPSTSQINEYSYIEFFEPIVKNGDLLHITFSSGMSGSANNAHTAADYLKKKYPEREIVIIDSLSGSSGYGLLVDIAADMRDNGCSLEKVANFIKNHRDKLHHQFFTTDLKYLKFSGRISGAAATIASVLNIYPLIRMDKSGVANAYDKIRGRMRVIRKTIDEMEFYAKDGTNYNGKCYISHANCPEVAYELKKMITEAFPDISKPIKIFNAGTITAAHCGPGSAGIYFFGEERPY